ncbi:MAG: Gfo/Idh/MocA family oxidoreductase [Pyrinomonadaceae bacterium]
MKDKIGIGFIGTGFARRTQIPGFAAAEDARLVSVSSGSAANAESTAGEFGFQHFSGDWRDTVSHADVDLVCITTPPSMHHEMASFALENGKHVLCEKPMAMNAGEASDMLELAEQKGLMAIIDHELRFLEGRMHAFKSIREGEIGKIRHIKYIWGNGMRGDKSVPWTWWSDEASGGGALGAIGSHIVDTIRWFSESEIVRVFCRLATHVKEREFEGAQREVTTDDETLMIMELSDSEFVKNATALVSASLAESGPYRNEVEIYGTEGAYKILDRGELFKVSSGSQEWERVEINETPLAKGMMDSGWSRGFTVIAEKICSALKNGETKVDFAATFADGLKIQKVLDAARESNSTGRLVETGCTFAAY